MTVRAKFIVKQILNLHVPLLNDVCAEVVLSPVFGDENADWSKYTPQGEIKMMISNPKAIEQFELGGEYFVDFNQDNNH